MIRIICVGKLKEEYLKQLVNDYLKRTNKYHKIVIEEIKDTDILEETITINKYLNSKEYNVLLDLQGKEITSSELSNKIDQIFNNYSKINFIIGGSNGVILEKLDNINEQICFSKLTFPHGLFRGMLLEQIYRSFKIINNENYHK